jgi:hypothetical protein
MTHELVSAAIDLIDPNDEIENMRNAILLAVRKNPRLKRGFCHLSLYLVARQINECYRQKHSR